VIAAAQRALHLTGLLDADPGAPVPAHIEEAPQPAVVVPDDQDALPADLHDLKLAGISQVSPARRAEPVTFEDRFPLAGKDIGIGVGTSRQRGYQAPATGQGGSRRGRISGQWHGLSPRELDRTSQAAGPAQVRLYPELCRVQ
jgi:hypothetical protein